MQTKHYENISETLITEKLSNGLTINIVPKPGFRKAFAIFAANYGGADRRFKLGGEWLDTPAGIAHFLEHKMFDMPYGNALNLLSSNGASTNAFTGSGMTAYHFECTDLFYENLKVLLEFVSTPYFSAESVQKEQGIIGQEIRMMDDNPGFVLYNNLLRCLYAANPVRDSVAGTVESIAKITDETLNKCHKIFYNPSNMTLAVVGDVDPEKVIKMAEDILPKEPGEVPERDYGEEPRPMPNKKNVSAEMAVSAPQFMLGAAIEPAEWGTARLRQLLTGDIALRLLFGRSSPVFTKLYSQGLLNGNFDYGMNYTAGTAMLACGGESRHVETVISEIRSYVDRLISSGIDVDSFEKARRAIFGSELGTLGAFSALGRSFASGAFDGWNPLDVFGLINGIDRDELAGFLAENFTDDRLALSVVAPLSAEKPVC